MSKKSERNSRAASRRLTGRGRKISRGKRLSSGRKEAEDGLGDSVKRLKQLVENPVSAILTLDAKGTITFWGKACEAITGWHATAALGENFASLILGRGEPDFTTKIVAQIFAGRIFTGLELDFRCRDGTMRKMRSRAYPLVGPDETVVECAVVSIDVSGQKLAETELAADWNGIPDLSPRVPD